VLLSEAWSGGLLRDGIDGSTGVGGGGSVEFSLLDGFKINPRRTSLADAVDFLGSGLEGTGAWVLMLRL